MNWKGCGRKRSESILLRQAYHLFDPVTKSKEDHGRSVCMPRSEPVPMQIRSGIWLVGTSTHPQWRILSCLRWDAEGSQFCRNVDTLLPDDTATHPKDSSVHNNRKVKCWLQHRTQTAMQNDFIITSRHKYVRCGVWGPPNCKTQHWPQCH